MKTYFNPKDFTEKTDNRGEGYMSFVGMKNFFPEEQRDVRHRATRRERLYFNQWPWNINITIEEPWYPKTQTYIVF